MQLLTDAYMLTDAYVLTDVYVLTDTNLLTDAGRVADACLHIQIQIVYFYSADSTIQQLVIKGHFAYNN